MRISSKFFGRAKLRAYIAKRLYNLDNLQLCFSVINMLEIPGKQILHTLGCRNCNMKCVFFAAFRNGAFFYQVLG